MEVLGPGIEPATAMTQAAAVTALDTHWIPLTFCIQNVVVFSFFFLFFFLFFLGPHPQHMEVPRLEVEWELQPPAYTEARDGTRVLMDGSRVHSPLSLNRTPLSFIFLKFLLFIYLFIYLFILVFLPFLGPLLQHMEAPRLGVEMEL